MGPKQTKILVTNLAELTPRYIVFAYQKRWAVEQINRELKSDLGMGEHQDQNRHHVSQGLYYIWSYAIFTTRHFYGNQR